MPTSNFRPSGGAASGAGDTGMHVIRADATTETVQSPSDITVVREPVKPIDERQTVADHLNAFQQHTGAEITRTTTDDGSVKMVAELPDGTRVGGIGATTADAFNALHARATAFGIITGEY